MEPEPGASEPREAGYRRVLGLGDVTLLVVGCIIGAGIFFNPQRVAAHAREPGLIALAWGAGGLVALAGALVLAELAGMYPAAGGMYVFLRASWGRFAAFLQGWSILAIIATGALAVVADFFAANLLALVAPETALDRRWIATGVLALLTALNVRGVRWGALATNVFSLGKLAALALLIAAGLFFGGTPAPPLPDADANALGTGGLAGFALALVPILFTYGGWQNATFVAAEVREPQRTVPRAMLLGTLIVIAVYVGVNLAYLRVLEPAAMAADPLFASRAAELSLGAGGGRIVRVGIALSTFGFCAAALLANARVAQAMSADGALLRPLAAIHPRWGTPHVAVMVMGAWSIFLVWYAGTGQLVDSIVFADALFFALCAAAVLRLRRARPAAARPYRCPAYPWVPLFFLAAEIAVLCAALASADGTSNLLGAGVLGAGALVYALGRLVRPAGTG